MNLMLVIAYEVWSCISACDDLILHNIIYIYIIGIEMRKRYHRKLSDIFYSPNHPENKSRKEIVVIPLGI